MPSIRYYISHAWTFRDRHEQLTSWLSDESWTLEMGGIVSFQARGVPKRNRLHHVPESEEHMLQRAMRAAAVESDAFIFPSGPCAPFGKWLRLEFGLARALRRPVLTVNLGEEAEHSPTLERADYVCGWSKETIADSLYDLVQDRRRYDRAL